MDGRKEIDSLAPLCQEKFQADPFPGGVFVFRSRRGTSIRILVYDGQGFWLAQKRLSKGRFVLSIPPMGQIIAMQVKNAGRPFTP
jgi:transposase